MSASAGCSGAWSTVATMRYRSSGSGATTTSPAGAKNRWTSRRDNGQSMWTSANANDSAYRLPAKPMPACCRTVLCTPSQPTT